MPISSPKAGIHYPGNLAAVRSWFPDDGACLDYLDWLRWPYGFRCTHCRATRPAMARHRPLKTTAVIRIALFIFVANVRF